MRPENGRMIRMIGFLGLAGAVLIALKLLGIIDWSWVWVTCPLWAGVILMILAGIFNSLLVEIAKYADKKEKENEKKGL